MDHQRAATHYQLLAVGVLNAVGKIFNNRTQLQNAVRKKSLITMILHQVVPLLYIGSSLELRAIVARVLKSQLLSALINPNRSLFAKLAQFKLVLQQTVTSGEGGCGGILLCLSHLPWYFSHR